MNPMTIISVNVGCIYMGSIFKSEPMYIPTSIIYMKFHEVHIANMDSMANNSVNRRWLYTRAVLKFEPIWLTFISDMYISIRSFCAKFYKDCGSNVITLRLFVTYNIYLN